MIQHDAISAATGSRLSGPLSRRVFLLSLPALTPLTPGSQTSAEGRPSIVDIHQHVGYSGRPDDVLFEHQRKLGITKTILLPAGRPVNSPTTHDGVSNGLQAKCLGNEACYQFALNHPGEYL